MSPVLHYLFPGRRTTIIIVQYGNNAQRALSLLSTIAVYVRRTRVPRVLHQDTIHATEHRLRTTYIYKARLLETTGVQTTLKDTKGCT